MTFQSLIGIAAGVLAFAAIPIYIADILKGNTKPSRVTWWVLSLLNIAITASYFASGARDTIWVPIAYAAGFAIVALLSLRYGEGSWERSDIICLLGALISLGLWWMLQSAQVALYLLILTDFVGLAPTIYKAYQRPWTESKLSWSVAAIASLLNIAAIETWTFDIASYPVYVFVTNALVTAFILFGKKVPHTSA